MVKCHNKPTETFAHGVISMIRIMSLGQIKGGDVYEIAYARSYPNQHWSKDSLYLSDVGALAAAATANQFVTRGKPSVKSYKENPK